MRIVGHKGGMKNRRLRGERANETCKQAALFTPSSASTPNGKTRLRASVHPIVARYAFVWFHTVCTYHPRKREPPS